jgi:hypothetical protein
MLLVDIAHNRPTVGQVADKAAALRLPKRFPDRHLTDAKAPGKI